jgi:hypothetical protein
LRYPAGVSKITMCRYFHSAPPNWVLVVSLNRAWVSSLCS